MFKTVVEIASELSMHQLGAVHSVTAALIPTQLFWDTNHDKNQSEYIVRTSRSYSKAKGLSCKLIGSDIPGYKLTYCLSLYCCYVLQENENGNKAKARFIV